MRRYCGIEVDRRINFLALAAFILSLSGITCQIRAFLQGADLCLLPPEQVLLVTTAYNTNTNFLRIAARMAYINRGAKGYHEIVKREGVSFCLGGKAYHQNWQNFVESCSLTGKPELKHKSSTMPTRVGATFPEAHITYFAPWPESDGLASSNQNYLSPKDFMAALASEKQITFEFWAETLSGERHTARCKVNAEEIRSEWALRQGFAAPVCRELVRG
jgi:hypothetical protein